MRNSNTRRLITGSTWRYRYMIATQGALPDRYDIENRRDHRQVIIDGNRYDGTHTNDPLPERGGFGYELAYLSVYGDSRALSRGDWDGGDDTMCAKCAEENPLSPGDEVAYYPLYQGNAEITGNNDCRVVRCDVCGDIIIDYETLALVIADNGDTESYRYDASDIVRAQAEYDAELSRRINDTNSEPWSIALVDCERMLDGRESGEQWPMSILAAMDSYRCELAGHIAAGQSSLPGFPPHPAVLDVEFPAMAAPLPDWMQRHTAEYAATPADALPSWLQRYQTYTPMVSLELDAAVLFDA